MRTRISGLLFSGKLFCGSRSVIRAVSRRQASDPPAEMRWLSVCVLLVWSVARKARMRLCSAQCKYDSAVGSNYMYLATGPGRVWGHGVPARTYCAARNTYSSWW